MYVKTCALIDNKSRYVEWEHLNIFSVEFQMHTETSGSPENQAN